MNPQTRNSLIFFGILAIIGVVVGVGFGVWYLDHSMKVAPFNQRMNEYTALAGNPAQFERDIELQFKVSEYGTSGTEEPRYMARSDT